MNATKNPIDIAVQNCVNETKEKLLDPDSLIVYNIYARSTLSLERDDEIYFESANEEEYDKKRENEPDDIIEVYIYYGATNRGGGISDDECLFVCDIKGDVLQKLTKDEFDEGFTNQNSNAYFGWVRFNFSKLRGSLEENYTDYSSKYK